MPRLVRTVELMRAERRAWLARHKAAGLCLWCVAPRKPGRSLCQRHMKVMADRDRERVRKNLEAGLCARCPKPRAPGSKRFCESCTLKNRAASLRHKQRQKKA